MSDPLKNFEKFLNYIREVENEKHGKDSKDKKFLFCCGSQECLIMAIYHREGI